MKKIGILGGTFNPIHTGHLILAENARTFYGLDEVLLIPSGCSYMKDSSQILPGAVRLRMAMLAAQGNPYFKVSDMEIVRPGSSYTYETIEVLRRMHPDSELYFIVGADTLFHMESWKYPERIFAGCITVAAVREESEEQSLIGQAQYLSDKYCADIRFLPASHIGISATQIRERLKKGKSVRYLVPENVRLFLEQNEYYTES